MLNKLLTLSRRWPRTTTGTASTKKMKNFKIHQYVSISPLSSLTTNSPFQFFNSKRDVILFCIDCSPSMQSLHDDPTYEDLKTSYLYTALEAAMQIQKKKVIVGPQDAVGIMFFNTVSPPF